MSPTAAATLRTRLFEGCRCGGEFVGQYVEQRDRGAFLGGFDGDCATDAAGGAGDQYDLAGKTSRHSAPPES